MKVRDLIKQLQKMPLDANVYFQPHDYQDGYADPVHSVSFCGDNRPSETAEHNEPENLNGTHSVIIS